MPGDVILTFNGKPVPSADDLDAAMDGADGKFEVRGVGRPDRPQEHARRHSRSGRRLRRPNETAASPPVQQ